MAYAVRPADIENDKQTILSLWGENLRLISEARFRWVYETNPQKPVECWVAEETDSPAGTVSLFTRNVRCGDRVVKSALPGYFAVSKNHRVLGPALLLLRTLGKHCDKHEEIEFFYGCPNKASEPVLTRLGHKRVGTIGAYAKPLKTSHVLARRHVPSVLAKLIGPFLDIPLKLMSRDTFTDTGSWKIEQVKEFDDRIDQLWDRAGKQFPVVGERTSQYLNWRYGVCPHREFRLVQVSDENNQIVAYFISWRDESTDRISDFFAQDEVSLDRALALYIRQIRRENCGSVATAFFGSSKIRDVFRQHGFLPRPNDEGVFIYGDYVPQASDSENWFLTEGETHY